MEEITIKYKIDRKNLRLFGKEFVENNKDICKLKIFNEEQELREFIFIQNFKQKRENKIKHIY